MTIRELKEKISVIPEDLNVFISSDFEGNDYAPMYQNIEIEQQMGQGIAVIYPQHKVVSMEDGYCKQCEHEHTTIDGNCCVCGTATESYGDL